MATKRKKKSEPVEHSENAATDEPKLKSVIWRADKEPPSVVRVGMARVELPDAETQRAGFTTEHADRLVRNIPGFKYLKPKGEK